MKRQVNAQNQHFLFEPVPVERLELQSKADLIQFIKLQQKVNESIIKENERLRALSAELQEQLVLVDQQYVFLKSKLFGKSSEREPVAKEGNNSDDVSKKVKVQLPSKRYPDAPLIEREVELQQLPTCACCGATMRDSGMTEDCEYLTVIPRQYLVVRQKRHKYCCGNCHGSVKTAPAPKRLVPGSAFSDELMMDVALSKYCDLIPIERYAAMAARQGLPGLPPQSLIEATHNLADFVKPAHEQVREEILQSKVLHADETPHRMLEGATSSNWHLWGFSNSKASFFDIRDTRSGDVASDLLNLSKCEFLVSDVFSGYAKAVRETNKVRKEQALPTVQNVYCNAHARRKFRDAREKFPEAKYFVDGYKEIYQLEGQIPEQPPDETIRLRSEMTPIFEALRLKALDDFARYPSKSSMGKALKYFLNNYQELTLFTKNIELPIDNNPQERLLRNPVIGRKTWYGTHSKRGSETAAILFSLVESCKLNKINPREYFQRLVSDMLDGKPPFTPASFKCN